MMNWSSNIQVKTVTKLNQTCRIATCFFTANEFFHRAQTIIVIVDPKYHPNMIGKACSGSKIQDHTVANTMMNVILHD